MSEFLCKPIMLGNMEVKNRTVMPPMVVKYATDDGFVTERMKNYHQARAAGGIGLIIVEASYINPIGQIMPNELGISDDKFIPGLTELVNAVHRHGTKIAIQLVHGGRNSIMDNPVAPSAIQAPGRKMPRELTISEIEEIVSQFGRAAARAKKAGFDGVEVHGAHSYLIAQFLSKDSNHRTDGYGGSLENRARLLVEAIKAVKEATEGDYPVWCRINGKEFGVKSGTTLAEAKQAAVMAEKAGAVAINVSGIGALSPVNLYQRPFTPGIIADLAAGVKTKVKIPVIAVAKMTAEAGEKLVAKGKADMIAFGRGVFADPDLAGKICAGRLEDIRPCIFCNCCRDDLNNFKTPGVACSVNAALGREGASQITGAEKSRKVLVVGGGPGGMETARIAALRGHQVSLWEKDKQLGGQLLAASLAPYKDRISSLTEYFRTQMKKLGVKVELGQEATQESVMAFNPDVVVIAMGATPAFTQIPGLSYAYSPQAVAVLEGKAIVGDRVAIIGGELVACEVAEFLADKGKKVTLMRRGAKIAEKVGPNSRGPLMERLKEAGVTMLTGVTYNEVTADGVVITKDGQKQLVEADTVVLAVGAKPEQGLYQALQGKIPAVYQIGDCVSPRTIRDAIAEGFQTRLKNIIGAFSARVSRVKRRMSGW